MHLLQYNSRLSCKFELNRSNTAGLRSVFLKYCRKNPKKHVFATLFGLFGPKLTFFQAKWSLLLFGHLLSLSGPLPFNFEFNQSNTKNLRGVFPKKCRKTPKNPNFRRFLAQNLIFFKLNLSFLLFAHLLQFIGRLPCKFELNRSNAANLRSVFLK